MIIDAKGKVMGRLASKVSEKLLKGESIQIINAEKVLITGQRKAIVKRYKAKRDASVKSNPRYGPKYPRKPDALMKKAVIGMLPRNTKRGRDAIKRLKVHIGKPEEVKGEPVSIKEAEIKTNKKKIFLEKISKALGAKW